MNTLIKPPETMFQGLLSGEQLSLPDDELAAKEEKWLKARQGVVTGSNFNLLIGGGQKGEQFTQKGYAYLRLKVAEKFGSFHSFKAKSTDWGKGTEAEAIDLYRKLKGYDVDDEPFRFIALTKDIGSTPDALVNCGQSEGGCLEVKCPWNPAVHINTLLTKKIPAEYQWQVAGHCLVTRRRWCDFVSFDPRIEGPQRLVVIRYEANEETEGFLARRLGEAVEWITTTTLKLSERTV